ncbi:MAG TPA: EAL domain-containing protein [Acidimicrobiia bacterium]
MQGHRVRTRTVRRFFGFAFALLLPVVFLGTLLARDITRDAESTALENGVFHARAIATAGIASQLTNSTLTHGVSGVERARLIATTAPLLADGTVLRLRVRDVTGRIVFDAEHPHAAPSANDIDDEVMEAAAGHTIAERTHFGEDAIDGEQANGPQAIEIYLALHPPAAKGHTVGVLEVYLPWAPIAAASTASTHHVYGMLAIALALLWLLLGVIMWMVTRGLRRESARNEHLALHDTLTGLPNRALFADRVEQALKEAQRTGRDVCVAIVDLDRFKEVNDTLGHANGDKFLIHIAHHLQNALRPGDTVARLGGDEFGLVLPHVEERDVAAVLQRVSESVAVEIELAGIPVGAEASIGWTMYPDDSDDARTLLQYADVAMYAAKTGRIDMIRYDPELDRFDPSRLGLVSDLRRAIGSGELELHYQPKIEITTGLVTAFEALIRWNHPTRGMLAPSEFLPIAESTGLISPLTNWVVEEAIGQIARWGDSYRSLHLAVNISARNLRDEHLADFVFDQLRQNDVHPTQLLLELTETSVVTDHARAEHLLRALASGGVHVSIDDFGQGYTSLGYLGHLPVSELKIDRTFVVAMQASAEDRAIVASVIELGHQLGLTVVAEGVETVAVLNELDELGCDIAQGFYFARPMKADDVQPWLEHHAGRVHA